MNILGFKETKNLLSKHKIPFCESYLAASQKEALSFAEKIGLPVVVKVVSPDILHKTDVGGIKTDIKNQKELADSFSEILQNTKKKKPKAAIEGVLVQEQVQGKEVAIGMKRDPAFGPILMFGLGGIFVEVLEDVVFRVMPVDEKEALKMVKEIKGYKILKGFRGEKPVNIKAIAEIIVNVSNLASKEDKIQEIDLNPVIVNEKKALVVDPRFLYG